jgi:hypothetical protein
MRSLSVALAFFVTSTAVAARPSLPSETKAVREVRIGVICYGGVSLAVYMHGVSRELHHLAMASAALECDAEGGTARCGNVPRLAAYDTLPDSAKPYYELLVDQWNRPEKVRPRVLIDVISGTSAGGINGIFLAKALTHNRPLSGKVS